MKRLMQVWVMILCLVLFVFTSVYAETITALASPVNPEHLENTASYARILGYDEARNTLTVELIVPEVFAEEDVLALEVGDSIFTGGQEVLIRSIDRYEDDGYLVINAGAYEHAPGSVYLHTDEWGNYMPDCYGHPTYNSLAVLECPVTDSLLFMDYTSAETGDALLDWWNGEWYGWWKMSGCCGSYKQAGRERGAAVRDGETALGIDNVYVVFDEDGQLATVQRFFVSWQ